jgi:hypothetical protein
MACYIFLKSLRSLEEFRKNPHVKIPPKSPSTNFQSLGKLKIQFLIQKFFFLISARPTLQPTRPLAPPAHWPRRPCRPNLSRPAHPARASIASLREIRLPFLVRAFRAGHLSLIPLTTGPRLLASSPTTSRPSSPVPPPIPGHRALPSSAPRVPPSRYHLAFISPTLISLLNPPPSSMTLKPLTPTLTTPATPPQRSPSPYKRRAPPPSSTTPSPLLLLTLHA